MITNPLHDHVLWPAVRRRAALLLAGAALAACGSPSPDAAAAEEGRARSPRRPAAAQPASAPQSPPTPANGLLGPDSLRVRAGIDSVFARFDRRDSPGCVATVMEAGRIVFSRGYGMADLAAGTPLSPTSAFDGASMAKQFLAFSVALLAAEGRLSLDDPVHRHLPELPDYGAPVTLRHLVHHTSGVRDWDAVWLSGRADLHPETLVGLSFPPGTRHVYDDTGYGMLEKVVERVAGRPWGAFARERVWTPLGMMSTGTPAAGTPLPRLVQGYAQREGGGFRPIGRREGFTVTAQDLARWDANFYDARVGGPGVIRMMTAEGHLASGETVPYAMALHTEPYRGLRRFWHGGLAGGYRSQFMRYPDQRTSVLVQCNVYQLAEPNALAEAVTDVVLADPIARAEPRPAAAAAPPPPAGELRRLGALYINRELPALRPVRFHDGRLQLRQWITWLDLTPLGQGRFRVKGQPLTLVLRPAGDGSAGTLEEHWDGTRTPVVLRAEPTPAPSAAELEAYAGRYVSGELGTAWSLAREGGGLRITPRHGRRRVALLRPAGRDAFSDHEYVLVLFQRDAAGRVSGFTVSTPRVQKLRFARRPG